MSDPSEPSKPDDRPPGKSSDKGDLIALGIGCLVVLIMFVAIVIVAATRE
jgi:hypothetical protein